MNEEFRSGFVGIIGRPNVGKSTLLNSFVKQKIAIISDKPQTTRHRIRCIVNQPKAQIVFVDTPGFHKPKDSLGEHLNRAVRNTFKEVDAIIFVVDASEEIGRGDSYIANELRMIKTPIILALNKTDKINKSKLAVQLETGARLSDFEKIIPISAKKEENIEQLLALIVDLLPPGPKYYPDEMTTDQPEAMVIAEFIREKVLNLTREEVPHSVAVEVEEIKPRKGKDLIDVSAVVYVERDSQKGILIGKRGVMLKEIGRKARLDVENLLGSHINLQLRIKMKKNWRRDEKALRQFGYS